MTECIEHRQKGNKGGYGYTRRLINGVVKTIGLHIVAYCDKVGIKDYNLNGMCVRHLCNNSRCVNPNHLDVGTLKDNGADFTKAVQEDFTRPHANRKLTPEQCLEVIEKLKSGASQRSLAQEYGVCQQAISYQWRKYNES